MIRRLFVGAIVLLVLATVPRYLSPVISTFGIGSPLARHPKILRYMFRERYVADKQALRTLIGRLAPKRMEVFNQNTGAMRQAVSRDDLELSPAREAGRDEVTYQTIKGRLSEEASPSATGAAAPGNSGSEGSGSSVERPDDANTKDSSSRIVNRDNVSQLQLRHVVDAESAFGDRWVSNSESRPLHWGRYVYWISAGERLIAVDVTSGAVMWQIRLPTFGFPRRGFLLHETNGGADATLYVPFGFFVVALNARTGHLTRDFGDGLVYLDGNVTSSPVRWNDQLVVAIHSSQEVRAIDHMSGRTSWSVPLHSPDRNFSGGAPWGGIAIDRARALLYVTTGNPRPALYGNYRPGDNRNSNSVIAVDLEKKAIKWAFQEVRHDLWDYDIPSAPILTEVSIGNRVFDVVIAMTKIGNTLMLDRDTGQPIFDFRLSSAPRSRYLHDQVAAYQPDVELPEPLLDIAFDPSRVTDISPESRANVLGQLDEHSTIYGRFKPPELNKNLVVFGLHGGVEWPGAAVSARDGMLYVPVSVNPWVLRVFIEAAPGYDSSRLPPSPASALYRQRCASCHLDSRNGQFPYDNAEAATKYVPSLHGYTLSSDNKPLFEADRFRRHHQNLELTQKELDDMWSFFEAWDDDLFRNGKPVLHYLWRQFLDQERLPASAPPWGKLVAINLSSGRKAWEVPLGEKVINGTPRDTGSPIFGGVVSTDGGLVFAVGTDDRFVRAIDVRSGETKWQHQMAAAGSAPPTTFEIDGRQYLCVVSTGGRFHNFPHKGNRLYIFSL